jgi:putrescine aminotransferase
VIDRDAVLAGYRRHVNSGMARVFELTSSPLEVRSEGSLVHDERGAAYLDCGGYCVFLLGHRHPRVVAAVAAALGRHPLSTRLLVEPTLVAAAEALAAAAPPGLEYVWFGSSGAEVVDAAIKLCRLNGCADLVAAVDAFHGKTIGALSISGRRRYRDPFEPLLGGVSHVPFGDAAAMEERLAAIPGRAAVFLEPVQSEAGVRLPPDGYLAAVRTLCDRHGSLLVVDEISTGLGRLGTWWGVDRDGVAPDVLLAGKALGGGVVPVSAMVASPEVFGPLNRDPLLHTSTFGGSPLAASAVVAALAAIRDLDVVATAGCLGARLLQAVGDVVARHAPWFVAGVRGRGLLIAVECAEEHHAAELMLELLRRRVLTSHSLNAHQVLRLTPPATLTEAEVRWLLGSLEEAVVAVADRYPPAAGRRPRGGRVDA